MGLAGQTKPAIYIYAIKLCKCCSIIFAIGRRILCLTDGEDTRSANKPDSVLDILKVDLI